MTAHVRKGFAKWYGSSKFRPGSTLEKAFRAGVRFEQGRNRVVLFKKNYRIVALEASLDSAMEILSLTPAGKREADKLREGLR